MVEVEPVVAALRNLRDLPPDEQELKALILALNVLKAAAPEIMEENLLEPLVRVFERKWDEVLIAPFQEGVGGNQTKMPEELTMLTASAAVVVLIEKFGLTKREARKSVLGACPDSVAWSNLRDWSVSTRRLTEERRVWRATIVKRMMDARTSEHGVLQQVERTFANARPQD